MAVSKLQYASGNAGSTTTSTSMTNTDTSAPLTSTTNFSAAPTPGEGMILLNEGAATEELAYGTGLSGGSVTIPLANRGLEGGSAQAHSSGASVTSILSAGMWNNMITALLNVLLQTTGALDTTKVADLTTAQVLTNKDLSSATNTLPTAAVTLTGTQTLTNKRITKRTLALSANSATPAINTDSYDVVHITAQTAAITSFTTSLTGTPVDGDTLRISVTGTAAVALTFGASFESSTITLPTTTVTTARLDMGFFWNTETSKWRCEASA